MGRYWDGEMKRDGGSPALEEGVVRRRLPPACTPQIKRPHPLLIARSGPRPTIQRSVERSGFLRSCSLLWVCAPQSKPFPKTKDRVTHPLHLPTLTAAWPWPEWLFLQCGLSFLPFLFA